MKKVIAFLICVCVKAGSLYPDLEEPPKQQYDYEYHDPESINNHKGAAPDLSTPNTAEQHYLNPSI